MRSVVAIASSNVVAVAPAGWGISRRAHSAPHRLRSSAASMLAGEVPSTNSGGSTPASFRGVCPPSETITPARLPPPCSAERCSAAITLSTPSVDSGSK